MTKKALILVDIQNDFLPGGTMAVTEGNHVIPIINHLSSFPFDLIVATKDWHPVNHLSFAVHHGRRPGEIISVHGKEQILWPIHCVQESEGSQFHSQLNIEPISKVFYKGTSPFVDSYSTFFDNDHISSTGLEKSLKEKQISTLFIAGLTTDYCVKYSVLDALELGFDVYVVKDACKAVNLYPGDEDAAIQEMISHGAHIIQSTDVNRFFDN